MPTATTPFGWTLTNVGPLTTVWTAPAVCATPDRVGLGRDGQPGIYWSSKCGDFGFRPECSPPGTQTRTETVLPASERFNIPYYSPGVVCPAAWTTVGIAARDAQGTMSSSGIYNPFNSATIPPNQIQPFNPYPNIFMEALAPGETAVVCCPSGYTAPVNGGCYSTLPQESFTAESVCQPRIRRYLSNAPTVTFTYYGNPATVTADLSAPKDYSTTTVTSVLDASERARYVPMTWTPGVTLVHKAADLAPAPTSTPSAAQSMRLGGAPLLSGLALFWMIVSMLGTVLLAHF